MKKYLLLASLLMNALLSQAVSVSDVLGVFKGTLIVGGEQYANQQVYILPGNDAGSITFVLPDFMYNGASLGDIVLPNIPMDGNGQLTLNEATLYIRAIDERATIDILNNFQDGATTYNSTIGSSAAQVLLSIEAPSVPEPIFVLFSGNKVTNENYAIVNGGFEGAWSNGEPSGWHSFNSATGDYVSFVQNTDQLTQQSDVRPGSTGSHSAKIQSKIVVGAKANGNCTNGQINAGSMTADDASGNYNFSDPNNTGYNTAFVGQPDSLVFWAKYIPADKNPNNNVNQARANAVITTNARYQDPEVSSCAGARIANAGINYKATSSMGWQRLSTPFVYTSLDPEKAAYILITFSSNYQPGGGSSYSEGGLFNKTYYLDDVYLDDAQLIYNHSLKTLSVDGNAISFDAGAASVDMVYSDSAYSFVTQTDAKAAKTFIGYDEANYRVYIYVVADNYSQAQQFSVYTLQMTEPVPPTPIIEDTEYQYEASICDGESYSDELFAELTAQGQYVDTLVNAQGGDSIVTLTLHVLPTYSFVEKMFLYQQDTTWRGRVLGGLPTSATPYIYTDSLKTVAGCDSVYTLELYVSDVPVTYGYYTLRFCEGEQVSYLGQSYTEPFEGDIHLTEKNHYGGDSILHLSVEVAPNYLFDEYKTISEGEDVYWEGWNLSGMDEGEMELVASYYTIDDCDSTIVLHLTVEPKQVMTSIPTTPYEQKVRKVLYEGQLYIIREDESLYDILGRKRK